MGEEVEERLDAAFLDDALVQLRVRRQVRQPERHLLLLARAAHAPALGDERFEDLGHGAAGRRGCAGAAAAGAGVDGVVAALRGR